MPQEEGIQAQRVFEQPADAVSFYCDFAQIIGSENEVLMQFYETIPGPPEPDGHVRIANTRLRATVMVSRAQAGKISQLLLERA